MNQTDFEIKILRQHWVKDDGLDNKVDLFSHGEVYIRIGSEELSTKESSSWTLSTTGLYLLRSLGQDCKNADFGSQLVPCCGHFMIPNENGENYVTIIGCPNGIDWEIKHMDGDVFFESLTGSTGRIPFNQYKEMVFKFVEDIEVFYGNPDEKILPDDDFDVSAFKQFWAEWHDLKCKWIKK